MPGWEEIVLAGCGGGGLSIFLPFGHAFPLPPAWATGLKDYPLWASFVHLVRNVIFGGAASFIIWAGYGASASAVGSQQVAASLIIGVAGVTIINSAAGEAALAHKWRNVYDETTQALKDATRTNERDT